MSIKDLFNKKTVAFESVASASADAESSDFISASIEENQTFLPPIDFSTASNFVKYGSAELYYENAIKRVYQRYPYDGSLAEKTEYHLSSSALDRWVYNYKYPKTTGYVNMGTSGLCEDNVRLLFYQSEPTTGYPNNCTTGANEYIRINGGIHTASAGMTGKPLVDNFDDSVVYHSASNRTTPLKLDFRTGATVEFWIKSTGFTTQGISDNAGQVIFDVWNGELSSSANYGRLAIYLNPYGMSTLTDNSPLFVTICSGSQFNSACPNRIHFKNIGKNIGSTTSPYALDWTHVAVSFLSQSTGIRVRTYVNGEENDNQLLQGGGSPIGFNEVTGKLTANIGALRATPPTDNAITEEGASDHELMNGFGKLNASLDEFRYWKVRRTSEEIQKNYFHPIGGGQNKKHPDEQLRNLGVYYKFNEGITGNKSTDSSVLDYSGRITNGNWVGYLSTGGNARDTGSAMVSASVLTTEPPDPIIYSTHPDVVSLLSEMQESGSLHDRVSGSFLYETLPSWIREEDVNNTAKSLFQIMASYFDTLYSQVSELNKLQDKKYFNVDNSKYEVRPTEFAKRMLEGRGLIVPELFPNSSILEYFMQRDPNNIKFDRNINDIKNMIYQNIYNNLESIFKAKGTHESYRNLLRCFGIDDEILKLNMYTDKGFHYFRDNSRHTSVKKRYLNFNSPDNFSGSVYPNTSSDGYTYIIGTKALNAYEKYHALTYEIDLIAPHKLKPGQSGYFQTDFLTSSIFGQHEAASNAADYTWVGSDDCAFQVYLIRESRESDNAYFMLTSSILSVELKSPTYHNIYDNERWNLAVRIKPEHFPFDGSFHSSSAPDFKVEFYGVNYQMDIVDNEFDLSATISHALGSSFLVNNKRVYMGAYRTNFTGSLLKPTDLKLSSLRVWFDYLDNSTIKNHALDPFNYGASKGAYSNYFMFPDAANPLLISAHQPKYDSLLLHWQLDTVTGSDSNAVLAVDDFSSGSSATEGTYGWQDFMVQQKNPGKGSFFEASSTSMVSDEYLFASRKQLPEVSVSYDRVFVKGDEEKYFIEDDDVSDNFYSLEKSFYGNISEEILSTFSTIVDFSNFMGKYQDRYKQRYKRMDYLKRLFFERIDGDLDFDQFTTYFKWIDSSISTLVRQLMPVSARISPDVSNVVENHILKRDKYDNKFPLLEREDQDPKFGSIKAVHELGYNWRYGHAPLPNPLSEQPHYIWLNQQVQNANPGEEYLITPNPNLEYLLGPNVGEFEPVDFTIALWIYPSSTNSGTNQIFMSLEDKNNVNNGRIRLEMNSNRVLLFRTRYADPNQTQVTWIGPTLNYDAWHHLVISFNGSATNSAQSASTTKMYLNGAPQSVSVTSNTITYAVSPFTGDHWVIGTGTTQGNGLEFQGGYDDIAIWKTILTPTEANTLYNAGEPYDLKSIQTSNIMAWWRCGDSPYDSSFPFSIHNEVNSDFPLQQVNNPGGIASRNTNPPPYSTTVLQTSDPFRESHHGLWWDERALRNHDNVTSITTIDDQRETIRQISTFDVTSSSPNFAKPDNTIYAGSAYALRRYSKPYKLKTTEQPVLHVGTNYDRRKNRDLVHSSVHIHGPDSNLGVPANIILVGEGDSEGLVPEVVCNDIMNPDLDSLGTSVLAKKKKRSSNAVIGREYEDYKFTYDRNLSGDMVLPFSIYSSSTDNMAGAYENIRLNYASNTIFTNLHSDTYGNQNDIGMQGPFSDTWVGGHQHRHVELNRRDTSLVSYMVNPNNPSQFILSNPTNRLMDMHTRPEAWLIYIDSTGRFDDPRATADIGGIMGIVGPDYGFGYPSPLMKYAARYRSERTKRPVNIKNIKTIRPQIAPDGTFVTSSNGVHRQFHPYFHSHSLSTADQIMTGSARHGNFYSNYEVVQTSGRSANNLYLRKAFGSADINDQESPILPEAMKSSNSYVFSGSTMLTDATHYSALYNRRPSRHHNDECVFLREPKHNMTGDFQETDYCIYIPGGIGVFSDVYALGCDGDWSSWYTSKTLPTNQLDLRQVTFTAWFAPLSAGSPQSDSIIFDDVGDHYVILRLGDGTEPNGVGMPSQGLQVNAVRTHSTDYTRFSIEIMFADPSGIPATWLSDNDYPMDQFHHLILHIPQMVGIVQPQVYLDGTQLSGTWTQSFTGMHVHGDPLFHGFTGNNNVFSVFTPPTRVGTVGEHKSYFGYVSDITVWYHENGLSTKFAERLYNRGFFIDPSVIANDGQGPDQGTKVAWWLCGRHDATETTQWIRFADGFHTSPPELQDMGLDPEATALANFWSSEKPSTVAPDEVLLKSVGQTDVIVPNRPMVVDVSAVHWEYAFDKNPSLSGSNSDSVFVERFSAPGGPEVMSRGFLDAAAGEYSVYNALPWRNMAVRGLKPRTEEDKTFMYVNTWGGTSLGKRNIGPLHNERGTTQVNGIHVVDQHSEVVTGRFRRNPGDGLNARLARHCGRYGNDPKYHDDKQINSSLTLTQFEDLIMIRPAWHKQQRNISHVPTEDSTLTSPDLRYVFDNAYVNTPIPRSDFQYSWVTASLGAKEENPLNSNTYGVESGKQKIYGYAPRDGLIKTSTPVQINGVAHESVGTSLYQNYVSQGYSWQNNPDFRNKQWTFAAWVRPNFSALSPNSSADGYRSYMLNHYSYDFGTNANLNHQLYFEFGSGIGDAFLTLEVPDRQASFGLWRSYLPVGYENEWVHLVVTFDASTVTSTSPVATVKFYLNTQEQSMTTVDLTDEPLTTTGFGGGIYDDIYFYDKNGLSGTPVPFLGAYDETVYFKRALTHEEVKKIWNSGKAYDYHSKTAPDKLVAWYRFGDQRDFQGDYYNQQDDDALMSTGQTKYYIYNRAQDRYHLEIHDLIGNIEQIDDSLGGTLNFDTQTTNLRDIEEAIVFPSASVDLIGV